MKKIMQERYSCREFNNQKINQETINEILDLTRLSPSSCGLEPWKFMVVSKENDLKELGIKDSSSRIYEVLKEMIINDKKFF